MTVGKWLRTAGRRSAFVAARGVVGAAPHLPGDGDAWLARRAAARIARRCRVLSQPDAGVPTAPTVLVMSAFRFWSDLDLLKEVGRLRLVETPTDHFQAINALFGDGGETADHDRENGERHVRFAASVLRELRRVMPFDALIAPSLFYRYLHPWAQACRVSGIPFIGLHKEFTVLDGSNVQAAIDLFRAERMTFHGTHALVVSETARQVIAQGGVAEADRIRVVGLPRMDRLFDPDSPWRRRQDRRPRITLFSFPHYCGNLEVAERRSKLFSKWDHHGFVDLFRNVHAAFAEVALERPDAEMVIKPKTVVDWWVREIEAVVQQEAGRPLDSIPNCHVVNRPAHDLIRDCDAIVAFNSTVILEAAILGRSAIVPLFDEACGRHAENVYLREVMDAFAAVPSKAALKAALHAALDGHPPVGRTGADGKSAAFRRYLGYDDAGSTARVVDAIEQAVQGAWP